MRWKMFKVKFIGTNKIKTVYAVNKDYPYIEFLIHEDDDWIWVEAHDYTILNECDTCDTMTKSAGGCIGCVHKRK